MLPKALKHSDKFQKHLQISGKFENVLLKALERFD